MTMDQYYRLMKDLYDVFPRVFGSVFLTLLQDEPFSTKPNKQTLRIHLKDGANSQERESITNGLRNFISDEITQLIDTANLMGSTDTAINLLNLFFNLGKAPSSNRS